MIISPITLGTQGFIANRHFPINTQVLDLVKPNSSCHDYVNPNHDCKKGQKQRQSIQQRLNTFVEIIEYLLAPMSQFVVPPCRTAPTTIVPNIMQTVS